MVQYRRNFVPGGIFFFTVALEDRSSDLLTERVSNLRESFRTARAERTFAIDAIVVLPDHLHTIMTLPEGDADFPLRWRRIKTIFTKGVTKHGCAFHHRDGGGRTLWQRRYWEHTIRDETDFARYVDYVHYNPVKHGYVANPIDWPHSSIHRFVRTGILPPDWGGAAHDDGTFGER
jgi:putative transposase